jgi:hypothetical protein
MGNESLSRFQRRRRPPGVSFQFQIIPDFVDFALPSYLYCPRLVESVTNDWKMENLKTAVQATKTKKTINHRDTEKNMRTNCF